MILIFSLPLITTFFKLINFLNDNTYIKDVLRLRFLSPDITEKILNGTQPPEMSIQKLININTFDWTEQRKLLNI